MTITRIQMERFTAFEDLDFKPTTGINVLIGANGTGKTHLMKVAYAACDITKTGQAFAEKLVSVFLPRNNAIGRLVKRQARSSIATLRLWREDESRLRVIFSNHATDWKEKAVRKFGKESWCARPIESVFIPVKEMLANAPGFRSLYAAREIHFESIYSDIIDRAFLPVRKGPREPSRTKLLEALRSVMDGKVIQKGEQFFLKNGQGELEFTLLAEGFRKLGLLWLLINNGVLFKGAVLFWDEPETNLNPQLFAVVVGILLQLQRMGVQIFVSTHDYAILKEFELAARPDDRIEYCALYRPEPGSDVMLETSAQPFALDRSPIAAAMTSLYDREVRRSLAGEA